MDFVLVRRVGMKKTGIITDSHSGIKPGEAKQLGIMVIPMPFYVEGNCYFENTTITREMFFDKLQEGAVITTSQPSPESVMQTWDEMLSEYEEILYLPMSSGLSGSCAIAAAFAQEEKYEGRVFVVDHGRVATPLRRTIMDAMEMVREGWLAEQIKTSIESDRDNMIIYIGVENLDCLKRGGRISATTAAVATVLNIKPVLQLTTGLLDTYKMCRGFKNARKVMINAMRHDIETRFKEQDEKGELYLMAASSADPEVTAGWVKEIEEAFPGHKVLCDDLTLGICAHVGYGGLGIGCSCRPKRPGEE